MEYPAFVCRLVQKRVGRVGPLVKGFLAHHDDIRRDPNGTYGTPKADHFIPLLSDCGLNDQHIEIAILVHVAARAGAEDDYG